MRRLLAIVLAALFSLLLIGPAFAASSQPDLPACCRKGGKHHCVMQGVGQSSSSAVMAVRDKCPCFPQQASTAAHHEITTAAQAAAIFAGWVSHPGGSPQTEAGYRISCQRSHQKRGPPSLLLS